MARLPRYFVAGQPQHIIQRGNNKEITFVSDDDRQFYLTCLNEAAKTHELQIHSYVLMTNHVHLLATPQLENSIPKTMQSVGRRYVQYFNYMYKRTGTLWEGRYKATIINSDQYLLICMRYIEMNPVRARMVQSPEHYPWSSYKYNAVDGTGDLVSPNEIYNSLGITAEGIRTAYKKLFRKTISDTDLKRIRESTNKGWVVGNDRFKEQIQRLSGRRTAGKKKGRPKKVESEILYL